MIMFIIILPAEDGVNVIEAKLHMGSVLVPVYILLGAMIYIVCSKFLKLFSKENRDLTLAFFPRIT